MSAFKGWYWNKKPKVKTVGDDGMKCTIPGICTLWCIDDKLGEMKETCPIFFKKVDTDFCLTVRVKGDLRNMQDQAGIIVRDSKSHYIRTSLEVAHAAIHEDEDFHEKKGRFVKVVLNNQATKEWSNVPLDDLDGSCWLRVKRYNNTIVSYYSEDKNGNNFHFHRMVPLNNSNEKLTIALYASCPFGDNGFKVSFENFEYKEGMDPELHQIARDREIAGYVKANKQATAAVVASSNETPPEVAKADDDDDDSSSSSSSSDSSSSEVVVEPEPEPEPEPPVAKEVEPEPEPEAATPEPEPKMEAEPEPEPEAAAAEAEPEDDVDGSTGSNESELLRQIAALEAELSD